MAAIEEGALNCRVRLGLRLHRRYGDQNTIYALNFQSNSLPAVGPLLGAAFVPLAEQFGVPLNTFVSGVQGSTIAAVAVGSLMFNCLAVKYGKRPIYLITTIGMMVACFWAAAAKSFASLVAARVLSGLCMGPFEALVPASIGDVWFVHERGFRTAIFNLGVLGGINLATPIGKHLFLFSCQDFSY